MLHYLIFAGAGLFGAGVATAYFLPTVRRLCRENRVAQSKADLFEAINLHVRPELESLRAFKAKYDQPRVGGKFAKKREGV